MVDNCKYDVAFSFLADDEDLARQVDARLEGRLTTFLYSKRQDVVAGQDGFDVFGSVFGTQSRIVVILYRKGWGDARFTLIERDAIRRRAFDVGWSFVLLVPLDEPAQAPPYVPPSYIYFSLRRYGLDGLCAVIERKVLEAGGAIQESSFRSVAASKQREFALAEARRGFRWSLDGVRWANQAAQSVLVAMAKLCGSSGIPMSAESQDDAATIRGPGVALRAVWSRYANNVLDGANLSATLFDTSARPFLGLSRCRVIDGPREYFPDLDSTQSRSWRLEERFFSTEQMADELLRWMASNISCPQTDW